MASYKLLHGRLKTQMCANTQYRYSYIHGHAEGLLLPLTPASNIINDYTFTTGILQI